MVVKGVKAGLGEDHNHTGLLVHLKATEKRSIGLMLSVGLSNEMHDLT
jgi:hypothetical protein